MTKPLVSIIIPVYNVEKYLQKCLDSCFAQSYENIEVIAVNDGSKDASEDVLMRYTQKEHRLKFVTQINQGVVIARKRGIELSTGSWIMFVDADDYLMNDAVETLYNGVIKYNADVSIASFVNISKKGRLTYNQRMDFSVKSSSGELASMLLNEKLPFSLCAKLFSKDLFKNVIHQNALMMGEDAYVTLQLINEAERVVILPHVVYAYLQHSSSVTHSPSQMALESRIDFINRTIEYYKRQQYYENENFIHCLNYFIMKEYFTYLRYGGNYSYNEIHNLVNIVCLQDKVACSLMPFWRIMMLRVYRTNIDLGNLIRDLIVFLRKFK